MDNYNNPQPLSEPSVVLRGQVHKGEMGGRADWGQMLGSAIGAIAGMLGRMAMSAPSGNPLMPMMEAPAPIQRVRTPMLPYPEVAAYQPQPLHASTRPSDMIHQAVRQTSQLIGSVYARQIEEALEKNAQAAHQSGMARALREVYGPALIASDLAHPLQAPSIYDTYTPPGMDEAMRKVLAPKSGAQTPLLTDTTDAARHRAFAQKPLSARERMLERQAQALENKRLEAQTRLLKEQMQSERARRKVLELQAQAETNRLLRERQAVPQAANLAVMQGKPHLQALKTSISKRQYQGIELPDAVYRDPQSGIILDLWQALEQGDDLSDRQIDQLMLSIKQLQYSAETPEALIDAEIIDNYTREQVIENKIEHLQEVNEDLWQYNGLVLERIEAEMAVQFDMEHYWKTERHLSPPEITARLKEYTIGLWDFLYGEDISTALDTEAHPLARVWAAAQFFPVMKVTKAGKLVKLIKLNTKGIPLNKIFPLKPKRTGFWSPGKPEDPIKNAYDHFIKHKNEFPEIQNAKQYVELAHKFMDNPPKGTLVKILASDQKALYHPSTNTLLFVKNGLPESIYRPLNGINQLNSKRNKGIYGGLIK